MDTPALTSPHATPDPRAAAPDGLLRRVQALPAPRQAMLAAGTLGLVVLVAASVFWGARPDWRVLYASLSDKDGGAVVAQLDQMKVPYRVGEGGGTVMVPADQVHDVRLRLAQAGLPKGSTVGFELMDNVRFGATQFQERLNFQRGLEGELVRSITALSAVQAARVHLALPQASGFFREAHKPSASVLLTLHPGRALERAQIAGIVHLVSSSVPELQPAAVSVLDQTGALLSGAGENASAPGGALDAQQLQHVARIEAQYARRIIDLLEPVVGRDNLRAQVTADVDFSQTESTSEAFRPNQGGEPAAVRSAQTVESGAAPAALPAGVPGALSNQPPGPSAVATAPLSGGAASSALAPAAAAPGTATRREAVTNYEVDKTVKVTRAATGTVRRIAVAVVINHRSVVDRKGQARTQPLTAEELDKMTALVREAVGFSPERGDSVRVVNAPFQPVVPEPALPVWQQPQTHDLVRSLAAPLAFALTGLALVLGVIRPVLRDLRAPAPRADDAPRRIDARVDDAAELPALGADPAVAGAGAGAEARLEGARRLARSNPAAVAQIVRGWVNGNSSGGGNGAG